MIEASVIIPTYNRREILKSCLNSLFFQDYPRENYEIIVVDDGSTDGTYEMFSEIGSSSVKLKILRFEEQRGPAAARNLGVSQAQGEVIIFVDSDIIVTPWFISEHMRYHKRYREIIVDGPAIIIENLSQIGHWSKRFLAWLDFFGASFNTSNTSCPKRVFLRAGGFDDRLKAFEDSELSLRFRKMGIKRRKNRRAYVYHLNRISSFEELVRKRQEWGIDAVLYYKKHPSLRVRLEAKFHYLLYDKLIFWLKPPFKENLFRKLFLIHAYAQGLREGLKKYRELRPERP